MVLTSPEFKWVNLGFAQRESRALYDRPGFKKIRHKFSDLCIECRQRIAVFGLGTLGAR
jgi:hypothetical protein